MTAWFWLWVFQMLVSVALLAWAVSTSRELLRTERERDDLWDECNLTSTEDREEGEEPDICTCDYGRAGLGHEVGSEGCVFVPYESEEAPRG